MKQLDHTRFPGILFVALTAAPSAAHLLALRSRISLPADDYLTVQQIHPGWALLGVVVPGAVFSTAVHPIVLRRQPWVLAAIALACLAAGQALFWACTAMLPDNWTHLRAQWEYSHATGALLNLSAFLALLFAALRRGNAPSKRF